MAIKERRRWFAKEWMKARGIKQSQMCERLGISKGRLSDLLSGKERWNADHLEAFARELEIERWQLTDWNPEAGQHHGLLTLHDAIIRIPVDEQERAIRAAQRMLESYSDPPPDNEKPQPAPKKKKA